MAVILFRPKCVKSEIFLEEKLNARAFILDLFDRHV